jgi:metal-dependent amidase/aminoacylase/carboxypeptidase family protein
LLSVLQMVEPGSTGPTHLHACAHSILENAAAFGEELTSSRRRAARRRVRFTGSIAEEIG